MKALALDVSLTATGWASGLGRFGTIETGALRGVERLAFIAEWVERAGGKAEVAAIEGYAYAARATHAHSLGEAGGVVRLALHRLGVPVVEIAPALIKVYAAGKGNASKELVLVEAVKRLGYEGANNNEADALWLWALMQDALGAPVVTVPQAHRKALASVKIPRVKE